MIVRIIQFNSINSTNTALWLSTGKTGGNKRAFFTWKSFIISGVLVSIFAGFMIQMKNEKLRRMEKQRKKALGEAAVGGKFDLIDQDGKPFSSSNLEGRWAMIYFGFTHCPDVCPDELEKIVKAIDLIEQDKRSDPIQPVFITVDPERDSVQAVREYIREFSPKFIGLTGNQEQVNKATRAYRVYYSAGPRDRENDYIVDHTIITYLINPDGELVDYYGQTKTAEDVANGVMKAMKNYRNLNRRLGFL
ncbi:SCO1-like protein, mitochondrial-like protein [Euroglyphus maynei]|uniref:SCO1-like protein, mitochondrial-like protein n=1 Tax=Euroglyphus maynei TaxID=6958 RepID=A0A1Y3AT60_EURMA|nr:SCO1-like protein, mitochondrial-like protein [Euroglyphus maynei]